MAITIPLWQGSSSFTTGSTPFGFFDSDASFASSIDKVATWCATRLGYPFNDIELQPIHFYTCFEEATLEYSNQVNQFSIRDNMFLLQGSKVGSNMTGVPGDISASIEIKKVFHDTPPAIIRYFDPFAGTGMGSQNLMSELGFGGMSPGVSFMMMPVYADLLRVQAIEFNDQIRKSGYSWELTGTRMRIFPIPTYDAPMYVQYITV